MELLWGPGTSWMDLECPGWTWDLQTDLGELGLNLGPPGVTCLDLVGVQVTMGTPWMELRPPGDTWMGLGDRAGVSFMGTSWDPLGTSWWHLLGRLIGDRRGGPGPF